MVETRVIPADHCIVGIEGICESFHNKVQSLFVVPIAPPKWLPELIKLTNFGR